MLRKLLIILTLGIFYAQNYCHAETKDKISKAILGEAGSEGFEGMVAVACAIRNRGDLYLVYGLNNYKASYKAMVKDCTKRYKNNKVSYDFCIEKSKKKFNDLLELARKAWDISKQKDIVNGANHWENIEQFGKPSWANDKYITKKINNQVFYKIPNYKSKKTLTKAI